MGGTIIDLDGSPVYRTPIHSYPLPGPVPGRFQPSFNGNNQYRLPDPITGEMKSYSRATSLCKVMDDPWLLVAWEKRSILRGLQDEVVLNRLEWTLQQTPEDELKPALNSIVDEAQTAAGVHSYSEFGTAVHAWAEFLDLNLCVLTEVPEIFRQHIYRYLELKALSGLIVVPEFTERIVMNSSLGMAGTIDRLLINEDAVASGNQYILGDIKTSRTLDYSWLGFAVQLGFYANCDLILSLDGTQWEPLSGICSEVAVLMNIPSDNADATRLVPVDLVKAYDMLRLAVEVKDARNTAAAHVPTYDYRLAVPRAWTRDRLRLELAVQTSTTIEELSALWEENKDVWTDDLTILGQRVLSATRK